MTQNNNAWIYRPYFLALFLAVAAYLFYWIVEGDLFNNLEYQSKAVWGTFVLTASILFAFSIERALWIWCIAFSLFWSIVLALLVDTTFGDNSGRFDFEFSLMSAFISVSLALPIFQTFIKNKKLEFSYEDLHDFAWDDFISFCSCWMFALLCIGLTYLIAALFKLIGIESVENVVEEEWFSFTIFGATFGAALGVLKENGRILSNLKNLVLIVFSLIAPVFSLSVIAFLVSIPFTGLESLWSATKNTTPILLTTAMAVIVLINTVIRNSSEDESKNRLLRISAISLCMSVLPLSGIALASVILRVNQYGFTPERIWGLLATIVGVAYGLMYLVSFIKSSKCWTTNLRKNNTRLAFVLCVLAFILALPFINYNQIAVNSQLARIERESIAPNKIDYVAFAYSFGKPGRVALEAMEQSDIDEIARKAKVTLESSKKWLANKALRDIDAEKDTADKLVIYPRQVELPSDLKKLIEVENACKGNFCMLVWEEGGQTAQLILSKCQTYNYSREDIFNQEAYYSYCPPQFIKLAFSNGWETEEEWDFRSRNYEKFGKQIEKDQEDIQTAIEKGEVEIKPIELKQLYIGGKRVGEPFFD